MLSSPQRTFATPRARRAPVAARRAGLTLIELLVVIVLVTTLVTTAIPIISPGGDGRKIREASRGLNAYLAGAQARAIETGRPFGVALHRLSEVTGNAQDNGVCVQVSYVEVPPPFAGIDENARVRVGEWSGAGGLRQLRLQFLRHSDTPPTGGLPDGMEQGLIPGQLLRVGDLVEVGGARWTLQAIPLLANAAQTDAQGYFLSTVTTTQQTAAVQTFGLAVEPGSRFDFQPVLFDNGEPVRSPEALLAVGASSNTVWGAPTPYKVFRQPAPAAGEPLQLPEGVAIDLQASGLLGGAAFYTPDTTPPSPPRDYTGRPILLFSPDGSVTRAYLPGPDLDGDDEPDITVRAVTESIALCVGRRELMPAEVATGRGDATEAYPFDPMRDLSDLQPQDEEEKLERMRLYNWLHPESRWVVLGAQSGSIVTVENTPLYLEGLDQLDRDNNNELSMAEQLAAARENAPGRIASGGR